MSPSPSPFPPIADYGFLSDCHTGALVAPDGSVDWLCLPAFDSASVFGNILDRGAGAFRFGPFGINVPTARTYVPGTNVLTTTWHTPSGWLLVHDALVIGPRRQRGHGDAPHPTARRRRCRAICWSAPWSASTGAVEVELRLRAGVRLRPSRGDVELADDEGHLADAADAGGPVFRLSTDMLIGIEGGAARARHVLSKGDTRVLRTVLGRRARADPPMRPRPRRTSTPRSCSGGTGWLAPGSPTTRCGIRSSGRP